MNDKKKTLLRDLKIKSVSVVDQGANQHAHIQLAKRDDQEEKPVENNDKAFFERIGQAVAKMLHVSRKGEEVEKDAQTFSDIDDNRKVREEIWRITDALQSSLFSIINDDELTGEQKAEMITTSAMQAAEAIKSDIAGMFSSATVSKGAEETGDEGAGDQPQSAASTTEPQQQDDPVEKGAAQENNQEGATDMKFKTEAMTPEEQATLADLQKRYGVEEPDQEQPAAQENAPAAEAQDDVNKGLSPELKREIEALRKFRQDAEERELNEVAKRYAIIGKKADELVPVLKSLKAAGGDAYAQFIAGLDSAVESVEKSGVFGEVGKSGSNGSTGDPWEKIETVAKGMREADPTLSYSGSIEKACAQHPDLVAEYENSRR